MANIEYVFTGVGKGMEQPELPNTTNWSINLYNSFGILFSSVSI